MNFDTLNVVVGLIALVSGATSAMLVGGMSTLRSSNSDLRARVGDLEDKNRKLTAEIVMAKADAEALARNVRGDDYFDKWGNKIDRHHDEATAHWEIAEAFFEKFHALLLSIRDRLPGGPT